MELVCKTCGWKWEADKPTPCPKCGRRKLRIVESKERHHLGAVSRRIDAIELHQIEFCWVKYCHFPLVRPNQGDETQVRESP
jgi:DNA-directed RNA polymerase subunit RPC12/RpoP